MDTFYPAQTFIHWCVYNSSFIHNKMSFTISILGCSVCRDICYKSYMQDVMFQSLYYKYELSSYIILERVYLLCGNVLACGKLNPFLDGWKAAFMSIINDKSFILNLKASVFASMHFIVNRIPMTHFMMTFIAFLTCSLHILRALIIPNCIYRKT